MTQPGRAGSRPARAAAAAVALGLLTGSGCGTKYYRVTDPTTGRVYYAERPFAYMYGFGDIQQHESGAVSFRDLATGDDVTILNSERREVSKDEIPSAALATRPHD